ncbi:MAG: hypothetical protein F2587_01805 [Actinobacteria bacterium]|uniref:Unannotated protein n=1 Tax=freshwater metagenome TaxID=449393 RepID=A0A6J6GXK7_9ZZZZ|nr:hypothetical protein [Actinomycetota bacterium]
MKLKVVFASYLAALTALTLLFVWPIYQDTYLLVTALVSLLVGLAIGANQQLRKASLITTTLLTLVAFLLLSLPLANPRALANSESWLSGFFEAITGPIQAWKQIITIELPIGTYHALLAPVLVLYLLTGVLFGSILFGKTSRFWLASFPVLAIVIFAISFGVASVPGDFEFLALQIPLQTPLVSGSLLFIVLVIYLNWGARASRRENLLIRQESLGFTANLLMRKLRRVALAAAVIFLAVSLTATTMQFTGVSNSRTVLRSGVEKLRLLQQQTSPLSSYRKFFSNAELLQSTILTYSSDQAPDRIRIATLPYFNGDTFTVAPAAASDVNDSVFFSRVPADLVVNGTGTTKKLNISLGKLDAIWLPIVNNVKRVTFTGNNSAKLSDSLFINRITGTAAIIPGLSNDSNYQIEYLPLPEVLPADLQKSAASIDLKYVPEDLVNWLAKQTDLAGTDGDTLKLLAQRLRARGFLSHALTEPLTTDVQTVSWVNQVDGLEFTQSTAGHNVSRINQMFKDLNDQEDRVGKRGNLVATAGDDEQFATAIALIATAKGFPARVVLGFRTSQSEDVPGVPSCGEINGTGTCKGANLTAWAEIQGANGDWLALDSTPQFEKPLTLTPPPPGNPKVPTDAGEDSATVLPPGKAIPSTDSNCLKNPEKCKTPPKPWWETAWDFFLANILPVIQGLTVLGILVGPFLLILGMKRRRRRSRRNHESEFARIVGAWEEYVDVAIDFGAPMPRNKTRLELARDSANPDVLTLAELANEMSYGSDEIDSVDMSEEELKDAVAQSWSIFDVELKRLKASVKRTQNIRAKYSLRSFIHAAKPKEQLKKLSSKMRFSQTGNISEGSGLDALWQMILRQLRSPRPKK